MNTEVCGYSNYVTFHCAIFLSNNRLPYTQALNLAKQALKCSNTDPNTYSDGILWLADGLEALVCDYWLKTDERESDCTTDSDTLAHFLLTAALGEVNWRELANEWLTTVQEKTK